MSDHQKAVEPARRQAKGALRDAQNRAQQYLDVAAVIMVALDTDGIVTLLNRKGYEILGYPEGTLLGQNWFGTCVPEQVRNGVLTLFQQLMARQIEPVESFENLVVTRSGEERIVAWHNALLADDQGKIIGTLSSGTDITDRKRAEEALQKAHEELERKVADRTAELTKANEDLAIFRRFVEASQQGFGMAKLNGEITYVNPAISRLLAGGRSEEVIGKHVSTIYSEDYMREREQEILPRILRDGHWQGEVVISVPHGSIVVLQNSFLVRDEQGNPAYLATVLTDITERRQAEAALQQSRDELQAIYDGMADGLLVADVETKRFTRANAAMCRMLGYSEEELLSMSVKDLHPAADLAAVLESFQAFAELRLTSADDLPILRRDGSVFFADVTSNSIVYNGRPCVIGFFRDISERKHVHERLQREHRTLKYLLQSSDHERQLIAYEIHDGLAQQLAGAIMQLQTFGHRKDRNPTEAAKAYDAAVTMLQQAHFEARRLIAGVRPPILDESGVVAAVGHLVNEQGRLKGPKIDYHSRVSFGRLAPIVENAIYRIVQEGLTNACQHSKSEKVRVSLVQRDDRVRIEVRDWGIGFDTKALPEKRFGLVGIQQRARLMGGKCRIQSKVGKGTSITVELPLVAN
jgi:PAS domain S-box-containing protein